MGVAEEAAKETIKTEKELESDQDQVTQDKIHDLAKENADEDRRQAESEQKRMLDKKRAQDKMKEEQEKLVEKQKDFKKASFIEAKHEQQKAAGQAEQNKKLVQLLDKKVSGLKSQVAGMAEDQAKLETQLKGHLA